MMWSLDVAHEYHHTLGGHVGASLARRIQIALDFVGGKFRETDDAELGLLTPQEEDIVAA